MGVPDPTVNMSGVAAHDQPLSQPRSSGRKRKPVSYAEDQPSEGAESPVKKRRSKAAAQKLPTATVDNAGASAPAKQAKANQAKTKPAPVAEKRLRRFRDKAPQSFNAVKERALTQRMFVIERSRGGTDDCPEENVEIAGTTGNVYNVNISLLPSCTCPHAAKGHQCKHIVYVLIRVLKAPPQLQYQLAFISSELRDIFSAAPPIPSGDTGDKDSGRKPVEGDCPICCEQFDDSEEIVWCKAACGNNVHKSCFGQWAATKGGHNVTCPYCRTPWAGDEDMLKKVVKAGEKNAEGYVNVASQLGLDGERDYSTYHPFWVRRQAREGAIDSSWRRFGLWDD